MTTKLKTSGENEAFVLRRLERFTRFQIHPVPPLGEFDRAAMAYLDAKHDRFQAEKRGDEARVAELLALMETIKPQVAGRGYTVSRNGVIVCGNCDRTCEPPTSTNELGRCVQPDCVFDSITQIIPRPAIAFPRILENLGKGKMEPEDIAIALDLHTDDEVVDVVRRWKIGWIHEQPFAVRVLERLKMWWMEVRASHRRVPAQA